MNSQEIYSLYRQSTGVSIDTRSLKKGNLFFGLKGEKVDGGQFVEEALQKRASFVFTSQQGAKKDKRIIFVKSPLVELQKLAAYHRAQFSIPFVAITGSNGKTTTKELATRVLLQKYKVAATIGNFNNHIGLPLTLLSIPLDTQMVVLEMGASAKGEIDFLANLSKPTHGYITNFGKAHLEGFGSLEGVVEGKSELYTYLKKNDGLLFVNGEDPIQIQKTKDAKRFVFLGEKNQNAIIELLDARFELKLGFEKLEIQSHLIGAHNFANLAFAIALGHHFGVSAAQIKEAIEGYVPQNNRLELRKKKDLTILLDAYNANPNSMKEALITLSKLEGKKGAILGDMFELGNYEKQEHQALVDLACELNFDFVFLMGEKFGQATCEDEKIEKFLQVEKLEKALKEKIFSENISYLLIKGSRKMALENLLKEDIFE